MSALSEPVEKSVGLAVLYQTKTNNEAIEIIEKEWLKEPQVECPLTHRFEKGIYIREIFMRAGLKIIGHEHVTAHWNWIICGRARVFIDEVQKGIIEGPTAFISEAGVRKVLLIEEDMIWQTIHPNPNEERDIAKLESVLVIKSRSYLENFEDKKRLEADSAPQLTDELPTKI